MIERHFNTADDVYTPIRDLVMTDRLALWHYLVHAVDHAQTSRVWFSRLNELDASRLPADTVALLAAVIEDNGRTPTVAPELHSLLDEAKPVSPPISLAENPYGVPVYRKWGFLL